MGHILFCRKVSFMASHYYRLPNQTENQATKRFGKVSQCHEHKWVLTIWLRGPLDPETGMMVDLCEVDAILENEILKPFHGRVINHQDTYFQQVLPTTEALAGYFAQRLAPKFLPGMLVRLRIAEEDDLFSEWHL